MTHARYFIAIVFVLATASAYAEDIQLNGADAFQAAQKSTCGTTETQRTRYGIFEGRTYSRVPGEKDRLLFNVLGINVRHCGLITDDVRGRGFRSVSREIMVYMDPDSGEVIDTWLNPWTGKTIDVMHVANDPVNMRAPRFENDEDGAPSLTRNYRLYGDTLVSSAEIPLFYPNPLGGDYQPYVGGTYHAMEIFNSFYDAEKMLDTNVASIGDSKLAWSRVAQWLPWLEMGNRAGLMVFNATGFSTFDKDKIPTRLVEIMNERYPEYWTPPPVNDARANETSWTVFKKKLAATKDNE
ncbi:MAG: DUF1838 family protein [Pseudomonadota bacterium]